MVTAAAVADPASLADVRLGAVALVELGDAPLERQDVFLQLIDGRVGDEGARLIVACPAALLDLAYARTDPARTTLLVNADEIDRQLALTAALAGPLDFVSDLGREDGVRIQRLAEEVGRIARNLAALAEGDAARERVSDGLVGFRSPFLPRDGEEGFDAEDIRAIIRLRRLRERFFEAELFADPAWDMLLDLMAARLERAKVPVSSLCTAAAVPATTALRWIKTLTDKGLFKRRQDPHDARRVFIELSDEAAAAMRAYLAAAKATRGMAV